MKLDSNQIQFIQKRQRLIRLWPAAGSFLILLLLGLIVWLSFRSPLLINPFEVMKRLDAGTVAESTLILSAALLPVIMLACIVILIVMVIFSFAAFSNEKKHLQIIERLMKEQERSNTEA